LRGGGLLLKWKGLFSLVWRAERVVAELASLVGFVQPFRSKWVRAFSNKGHQTGLPDFLEAKATECSPRRSARLARNWAVKSNGEAKSQETQGYEVSRTLYSPRRIR